MPRAGPTGAGALLSLSSLESLTGHQAIGTACISPTVTRHLVGPSEVAAMLGVARSRVYQLAATNAVFPEPRYDCASELSRMGPGSSYFWSPFGSSAPARRWALLGPRVATRRRGSWLAWAWASSV